MFLVKIKSKSDELQQTKHTEMNLLGIKVTQDFSKGTIPEKDTILLDTVDGVLIDLDEHEIEK